MTIAGIGQALKAYATAARRVEAPAIAPGTVNGDFGGMVRAGLERTSAGLKASETKAVEALTGRASLQDVVEAVTEAELSLQKMTAVRDRVISAYQEIMRMPI